jgi:hypothetical protein
VRELGIGTSVPIAELTAERLASALRDASEFAIGKRADAIAGRIAVDGAAVAARRLIDMVR